MTARSRQELALLKRHWPDLEHVEASDGRCWVRLRSYPVLPGWNKDTIDVCFVIPNEAATPPYGFYVPRTLLIKRGVRLRPRMVVADVLLLPIVALIAYSIVTKAGVQAEGAALSTAFCTVCADRLIKLMAERFMGQVDEGLGAVIRQRKGEIREELQMEISGERVIKDIAVGKRTIS